MDFWKTKLQQLRFIFLLGILFFIMIPISVQAAELPFTKSGNYMIIGGTTYRQNNVDASTYVPVDGARGLDNTNQLAQLLSLPGGQTGYGNKAKSAAFRYRGFASIAGSSSQYLVKYAEVKTVAYEGFKGVEPAYYYYNGEKMLSFRYIGMVVTKSDASNLGQSGSAIAGTNPRFPSDMLQENGDRGGNKTSLDVWTKKTDNTSRIPKFEAQKEDAYGTTGGVHDLIDMYKNGITGEDYYHGNGNILSNKYSPVNQSSYVKEAFERWEAGSDGYGKAYRAKAEDEIKREGLNIEWWELLNQYFQINGDPSSEQNTLYFYMVGGTHSNTTYYNTYCTEGKIQKNATPTLFAIKDNESGEILSESYRNASHMDSGTGAGSEEIGAEVKLYVNKYYTLEGILSYYSQEEGSSKTDRGLMLCYLDKTGLNNSVPLSANMISCSTLPDASALNHVGPTDRRSTGTIKASGNKTEESNGVSYYYNGACFSNTGFYVTTELPMTGYLMLIVPDAFGENGDNDVLNDDRIVIPYVIIAEDDPIPEYGQAAFGDLNLGMPEYRDLHYIAQYEEPPEEEEGGDEGGEGEGAEDAEPPEPIIVTEERYSGYGYYKSAESAPKSEHTEDYEEKVENRRDIWNFNFFTQTYV